MVTEGVAMAQSEVAIFKAVNGNPIGHPGDRSDEERTGLVGTDRIAMAHDPVKLRE